jgi:hypothetical protein
MSGALGFEVFDSAGKKIRQIDGLTRQALSSPSRVDGRPWLAGIAPGETWDFKVQFGAWHQHLPAGNYQVRTCYTFPPAGIELKMWNTVKVEDLVISGVQVFRDNPNLERVIVLLDAGPTRRVLFHAAGRPLTTRHEAPLGPTTATTIAARATFITAASFDPFYNVWMVELSPSGARAYRIGQDPVVESARTASLPAGRAWLPEAHYDEAGRLYLYCRDGSEFLECYELSATSLALQFRVEALGALNDRTLIARQSGTLDVFCAQPRLSWQKFTEQGVELARRVLAKGFPAPRRMAWNPKLRQLASLHSDYPKGRSVVFLSCSPDSGAVTKLVPPSIPRGRLTEAAMDLDPKGRIQALMAFGSRLYYYSNEAGPRLVASRADPGSSFHPQVCADGGVYLGFVSEGRGFRFHQYSFARQANGLIDYDTPR